MQPITRSKIVIGTHSRDRTCEEVRVSTALNPPPRGTSPPRMAIPCSRTWRVMVRLTCTGRSLPGGRFRAKTDSRWSTPLPSSRMAPCSAGEISKIRFRICCCSSSKSRIECTIRLIFSSALRFRARREVTGSSLRILSGCRYSTS